MNEQKQDHYNKHGVLLTIDPRTVDVLGERDMREYVKEEVLRYLFNSAKGPSFRDGLRFASVSILGKTEPDVLVGTVQELVALRKQRIEEISAALGIGTEDGNIKILSALKLGTDISAHVVSGTEDSVSLCRYLHLYLDLLVGINVMANPIYNLRDHNAEVNFEDIREHPENYALVALKPQDSHSY